VVPTIRVHAASDGACESIDASARASHKPSWMCGCGALGHQRRIAVVHVSVVLLTRREREEGDDFETFVHHQYASDGHHTHA
jgi:hypothetical protein